jgi:ZIP family zinc transporter
MIYISFTEILSSARIIISGSYEAKTSAWLTLAFFIIGFFITALIDKLLPSIDNPHEAKTVEQMTEDSQKSNARLLRVG